MTKHDYKQTAYYLIYLIKCVLNNKIPAKEKLDKMDLSQLYEVAKNHSLTAMAAYALESAGIYDERFTQAKAKAIRKNAMLDIERSRVLAALESAGIWYCPLKGCIINEWYPKNGMRQMADNDILCDETKMNEIRAVMEGLGFVTDSFGKSHQDTYHKPPVCSFEMHSSLLEPRHGDILYSYYRRIKENLVKDEDSGFGFHFGDEDFYVYFTAHEYKHFTVCGIGLRSLVDTYLIHKHYGDGLDLEYVGRELRALGLAEFEAQSRALALKLFDGVELTDSEKKLLDYFISSGTYGNVSNRITNSISANASVTRKVGYAFGRLKLPEETLREFHPFFHKHKALRPFLYAKRLFMKMLYSSSALKNEVRALLGLSNNSPRENGIKRKLKKAAVKIRTSHFAKPAKICYDFLLMAEYHLLSVYWRAKGFKLPSKEEARYVAENVTFIYKSFERQYMAKRLFRSIQKFFPGARVIIADDSKEPLVINSEYVRIIQLPFNSGLSYGLNRALAEVRTPYTMRMDDDELLTSHTKIYEQLRFLEMHSEIDLSAVQLCTPPLLGSPLSQAKRYYKFDMSDAPKELLIHHMTKVDDTHIVSGKTPNTFLIRTEKYKALGYDDNIRMIDHHEFFYRAAGNIVSAMDTSAFVFHYHNWFDRNYSGYRDDTRKDSEYIRRKHGDRYYG